jgi:DNA-binding NtrC family response regulator
MQMSAHNSAILIIEHDPVVRQLYIRTLQHEYTVLVSDEIAQCQTLVQRDDVHAVIIEPHRPDGLGEQLLAAVTDDAHRSVPIVVCSVLDHRRPVQRHDIRMHLVKPVAPEMLRAVLTQLVASSE